MFRSLCVLLLLIFPLPVLAAPALLVDGQDYDFGSVLQGESIQHTFRFQNSGDDILEITSVNTSCGCTAALLSSKRLAPGDIGELRLTFDSQGFRGKIHKAIEITTNDPQRPSAVFNLTGSVDLQVFVSPERVNWRTVEQRQTLTAQVVLNNYSEQTVVLKPLQIIGKGVAAVASAFEIAPGDHIFIDITAEFSDNAKRISGYVIIPTNFSRVPQIRVPVSARLSKK